MEYYDNIDIKHTSGFADGSCEFAIKEYREGKCIPHSQVIEEIKKKEDGISMVKSCQRAIMLSGTFWFCQMLYIISLRIILSL